MKIYCTFMLCCLFIVASALPSLGTGALHAFTTTDGRSLKATVLDFNTSNKKIHIEREDGKKIWILPSVFSESDQEYIQQWIVADQFMSPSKFRIKGKKIKGRTSKIIPGSGLSSKETTQIAYEIILENKTDFPLKNLKIEYRTFILNKAQNRSIKYGSDSRRVGGGQLSIAQISAGKKGFAITQSIVLTSLFKTINESGYDIYTLKISEEELEGLWIKIYGPEVDGVPTVREWCNPADTRKNFAWKAATPAALANSNPNQPRKVDPAKEIERLIELYETNPSARTARNIGYAYEWKLKPPNIPLALEWYKKAAAENNAAACRGLAGIYSSFFGHPEYYSLEKTIKYALQALSIEPNGHTEHRMMAKAYAVDGQFDKAVEHLEKALEFLRPHRGKGSVDAHILQMEKTLERYKSKRQK